MMAEIQPDSLEALGREAAQEAWAEHGGDLDAIPNRPGLRAWARVAFTLGLAECEWHLTEPERRTFVHAYRNELQALDAAHSLAHKKPSPRSVP